MGIEAHLIAQHYFSATFASDAPLVEKIQSLELDFLPEGWVVNTLRCTPLKWYKDYHIIDWFIKNCEASYDSEVRIDPNDLKRLRDECSQILANEEFAETLIPESHGDYDDWYYDNIKMTHDELDKILSHPMFDKWEFSLCIC